MTRILLALFLGLASSLVLPALAQEQEKRLALVIGNGAYEAGALQTAANDAGLVAQTLQAAGFDVIGARDLDGETLRKSFRDFVQKVQEAGPNTVAFVYLAGYGVQLIGENAPIRLPRKVNRSPAAWRWSSRTQRCWSPSTRRRAPSRRKARRLTALMRRRLRK